MQQWRNMVRQHIHNSDISGLLTRLIYYCHVEPCLLFIYLFSQHLQPFVPWFTAAALVWGSSSLYLPFSHILIFCINRKKGKESSGPFFLFIYLSIYFLVGRGGVCIMVPLPPVSTFLTYYECTCGCCACEDLYLEYCVNQNLSVRWRLDIHKIIAFNVSREEGKRQSDGKVRCRWRMGKKVRLGHCRDCKSCCEQI